MEPKSVIGTCGRVFAMLLIAMLASFLNGCATVDSEGGRPLCMEVLNVRGDVTFSNDGKNWTQLRRGDELLSGSRFRSGEISYAVMHSAKPTPAPAVGQADRRIYVPENGTRYVEEPPPSDIVLIFPNSLLAVEKLTWSKAEPASHTNAFVRNVRLDLSSGKIACVVGRGADGTTHEARFPNGSLSTGRGWYTLTSSGIVHMLEGKAAISVIGKDKSVEVTAGHAFDSASSVVLALTQAELDNDFRPFPDEPTSVARTIPERPFSIPQRRF